MWEIRVDGKRWNGEAMVEIAMEAMVEIATETATETVVDIVEGIVMIRVAQDMESHMRVLHRWDRHPLLLLRLLRWQHP